MRVSPLPCGTLRGGGAPVGARPVVGAAHPAAVRIRLTHRRHPDARPSEEFFAQVVVVYSATDDEAAVQLTNSSSYGLSGAVYCSFEHGS